MDNSNNPNKPFDPFNPVSATAPTDPFTMPVTPSIVDMPVLNTPLTAAPPSPDQILPDPLANTPSNNPFLTQNPPMNQTAPIPQIDPINPPIDQQAFTNPPQSTQMPPEITSLGHSIQTSSFSSLPNTNDNQNPMQGTNTFPYAKQETMNSMPDVSTSFPNNQSPLSGSAPSDSSTPPWMRSTTTNDISQPSNASGELSINSSSLSDLSSLGSTQPVSLMQNTVTPPTTQPTPIMDSAPTDLSHLINAGTTVNTDSAYTPTITQPETLVAPPGINGAPVIPNIPTETIHKGVPKWAIGIGIGLFLAVAGASGYFILGLGQKQQSINTTSLPATQQQQLTSPPAAITPTMPPATQSGTPGAEGSGSFGNLDGSSTEQPQATTAGELLRQRQLQQQQSQ